MSSSKVGILVIYECKLDFTIPNKKVDLIGFELVKNDRKVNRGNGGDLHLHLLAHESQLDE